MVHKPTYHKMVVGLPGYKIPRKIPPKSLGFDRRKNFSSSRLNLSFSIFELCLEAKLKLSADLFDRYVPPNGYLEVQDTVGNWLYVGL